MVRRGSYRIVRYINIVITSTPPPVTMHAA
eukprot:SAG31_NODE_22368_length_527_cov_0.911215_1_plen_29_part_01